MKTYMRPAASSMLAIEHYAFSQYFLDDHSLTVLSQGPNGCGLATETDQLFICVSGNEDVSSELAGLAATSSLGVENTIISCSAGGTFTCASGIGYTCQVGSPGYNTDQCISSLSDSNGNTIDCGLECSFI